ncbi:MAG: J domain-containing protein [Prevotellaceae bacterium]|jgi:hypothetical protein|nr:J domain-containing protein [Prevotellaceae bacterium]
MFKTCTTADQCKTRYRELAKELHPDKQGGSSAAFQAMQAEYEARLAELIKGTRTNSIEYTRLVTALLEILKITKPEYYELVKLFGNHPTVQTVAQLITQIAPGKGNLVNNVLKILQ